MSYYMGDYYAGDPGIGSFLGGLAKRAVGFIPGVGPLVSRGVEAITAAAKRPGIVRVVEGTKAVVTKHPVLTAAGGAGAIATVSAVAGRMSAQPGRPTKGMHMNKHGKLVRNRRMNPCNPRALRRSVRRLHSFAKHYRHVVGFVSPKKPKGRMYFKKRRRSN